MKTKEIKEKYKRLLKDAIEDLKTPGKRYKQIPNILTASRLLAPIVILPAALTGNFLLTGILAGIFGLTDLADGFIARKLHLQSELGEALDAATDKLFVGTLLLAASFANPFLLVNFALEAAIASLNIHNEKNGKHPKSTKIGKLKTWALFTLSALGIIGIGINLEGFLPTLALGTSIMQLLTFCSYINISNSENSTSKEELTSYLEKEPTKEKEVKNKVETLTLEKTEVASKEASLDKNVKPKTRIEKIEELEKLKEYLVEESSNKTDTVTEEGPTLKKKNKI